MDSLQGTREAPGRRRRERINWTAWRHQGGRKGLIGRLARHQGGTTEAGKSHLDTREAPGRLVAHIHMGEYMAAHRHTYIHIHRHTYIDIPLPHLFFALLRGGRCNAFHEVVSNNFLGLTSTINGLHFQQNHPTLAPARHSLHPSGSRSCPRARLARGFCGASAQDEGEKN